MFLVGGPPFSGTTLLALLLTQGDVFCLDEPDFHNPEQSHRGIPFLKTMFPEKTFPEKPLRPLTYEESVTLFEACEKALHPMKLGVKMCNTIFIEHAKIFKKRGYPVISIIRDIRDAMVAPLPDWINEIGMNHMYRLIWQNLEMYDFWFRYEDLVTDPERIICEISRLLGRPLEVVTQWDTRVVHAPMLKTERHNLLKTGAISKDRVGIWRNTEQRMSTETQATAKMMGY